MPRPKTLVLPIAAASCLAFAPIGRAADVIELVDRLGAAGDHLGTSVALDGPTLVAGAPETDILQQFDAGSAAVFRKRSALGAWRQDARFVSSITADFGSFGRAVSVSGDLVASGLPYGGIAGFESTSVFRREPAGWVDDALLVAPGGADLQTYGMALAMHDERLVIGAPLTSVGGASNTGVAHVYRRQAGAWMLERTLGSSDPGVLDDFGSALSLGEEFLAVGSPHDDTAAGPDAGSVTIFRRDGTTWTETQRLTASDGKLHDTFGASLDLDGELLVVGSPNDALPGVGVAAGSATVFRLQGGVFVEEQLLFDPLASAGDAFGTSVAVSGDRIVVGSPLADADGPAPDAGAALVFRFDGTAWVAEQRLTTRDDAAGDHFGASVALEGRTIVVGAPLRDVGTSTDQGAVFVFGP